MKLLIVFALCVVAASGLSLGAEWEKFKSAFNKTYELKEEIRRVKTFYFNLARIAAHNAQYKAGLQTYHLDINEFADWTQHEFDFWRKGLMKAPVPTGENPKHVVSGTTLPDSVDWRDQGYVTDVKNQGSCGSCWSFSTTGSVEGQLFKSSGQLTSLSEQNLVDCSGSYGNQGCNGGLMDQAFQYIRDNGIMSEADYPYTGTDGTCNADSSKTVTKVKGFVDVASGDESALQDALANVGPISVAIDASHWSFQFYSGGIYSSIFCSSTSLDHGVLAVGYGTDSSSGKNYWIVKNSWGSTWGEKGFFQLLRSKNECGIATQASYPTM